MPTPSPKISKEQLAIFRRMEADIEHCEKILAKYKWDWLNVTAIDGLARAKSYVWATMDGANMEYAAFYGRAIEYPRGAKKYMDGKESEEALRHHRAVKKLMESIPQPPTEGE